MTGRVRIISHCCRKKKSSPPSVEEVLIWDLEVSAADAWYRDENNFRAGSLVKHKPYWDAVILAEHPQKEELSYWLADRVRIESFLKRTVEVFFFLGQAYVTGKFPQRRHFPNYIDKEWYPWVTEEVWSLVRKGVVVVRDEALFGTPYPEIVAPLLLEEAKPRLCMDASYLNLFCEDRKFSMDGVAKVPVVGWEGMFQYSLDHKSGYFHVPLHRSSWKYFGFKWNDKYFAYTVLPFGWKNAPFIYSSLTEATAMYARSVAPAPVLTWIDDIWGQRGMYIEMHRGRFSGGRLIRWLISIQ